MFWSLTADRLRRCSVESAQSPTQPTGFFRSWATATAVLREMSYPQLYVPFRYFTWATPPPLGRILVLLCYWGLIVGMMVDGAVVLDSYYWERIGFRNAWVTMAQMPLVFMLSSKVNIIGLMAGTSHERLNWLHRWVGRTMLVTATMHGFHFYSQYVQADFWQDELRMMPMVKYGLGAWAVLLWTAVASFAPLRRLAYEVFVAQHVLSYVFFIWLVYVHVPAKVRFIVWWTVAVLCLDRAARLAILAWQNVRVRLHRTGCNGQKRFGHEAQLRAVGSNVTVVTLKDAHFRWRAGQHVYLWLPAVAPLEAHPYTIACAHQVPETCICNSVQLVIRSHGGFSKRVHDVAARQQAAGKRDTLTAFVLGPYGAPPRWDTYETLVLISASTGASFTLPILESVLQAKSRTCTRRIEFVLTTRRGEEISFYVQRLREALERAKGLDLELVVHIAITGPGSTDPKVDGGSIAMAESAPGSRSSSSSDGPGKASQDQAGCCCAPDEKKTMTDVEREVSVGASTTAPDSATPKGLIREYSCRPDIERHIREPVEAADGETSVVVCGGPSLVSRVRNCVARLSDERAVHKGTGAQGIHLHVEEYSF